MIRILCSEGRCRRRPIRFVGGRFLCKLHAKIADMKAARDRRRSGLEVAARLVLAAVLLAGAACASAPVKMVGPCVVTDAGDLCCSNDFRVCPGSPREVDENGCYFDGCNTCCPAGGQLYSCTLRACLAPEDLPDDVREALEGDDDDGAP